MDLSVNDVSNLLMLNKKEVEKLSKKGIIPSQKIQNILRFNKHAVIEWALLNNTPVNLSASPLFSEYRVESITPLLSGSSFHYGCNFTRDNYIQGMVSLLDLEADIDRNVIEELLISREKMMSTAIGNGISLPHPRIPIIIGQEKPLINFFFLKEPIDLDSIDGKPVHTIILILSQTIKQHLRLLAHVSFLLYKNEFHEELRKQSQPSELLKKIKEIEKII